MLPKIDLQICVQVKLKPFQAKMFFVKHGRILKHEIASKKDNP